MLKPVVLLALVSSLAPSFAKAACPVINGTFGMEVEVGGRILIPKVIHYTRQDGDKYSYSMDGTGKEFYPADGKPRPLQVGERSNKVTIHCSGNEMSVLIVADKTGDNFRIHITKLNEDELEVRSNAEHRTGIYTRL